MNAPLSRMEGVADVPMNGARFLRIAGPSTLAEQRHGALLQALALLRVYAPNEIGVPELLAVAEEAL